MPSLCNVSAKRKPFVERAKIGALTVTAIWRGDAIPSDTEVTEALALLRVAIDIRRWRAASGLASRVEGGR